MTICPIISAEDARDLVASDAGHDEVIVFDGSAHMPKTGRNAEAEFHTARIPNARRFDIDTIALPDAAFAHTMPTAPLFERHMQLMGVKRNSHILVYDDSAIFSSARVWFMLRYFGHEKVQVIDGGLKAWKAANGKLESGKIESGKLESGQSMPPPPAPVRGDFIAQAPFENNGLISIHGVKKLVSKAPAARACHILDARSAERFYGRAPEPRAGLASGHMPGSVNIPFTELLDPDSGKMKPVTALKDIFKDISHDKAVVATCGSGVTACALILALALIGRHDAALYDGSWLEWGSRQDCPVSV